MLEMNTRRRKRALESGRVRGVISQVRHVNNEGEINKEIIQDKASEQMDVRFPVERALV